MLCFYSQISNFFFVWFLIGYWKYKQFWLLVLFNPCKGASANFFNIQILTISFLFLPSQTVEEIGLVYVDVCGWVEVKPKEAIELAFSPERFGYFFFQRIKYPWSGFCEILLFCAMNFPLPIIFFLLFQANTAVLGSPGQT